MAGNSGDRGEAQGSAGDFGRGDRDGSAPDDRLDDKGGNYDPSQGGSPSAFPSYGGSERQAVGGGAPGRGEGDPFRPDAADPGSNAGGTSGASSAIGDGSQRRAASGSSGSVSDKPTAAGGEGPSDGSGAMGNASGPSRTDTAPASGVTGSPDRR